MGAHVNRQGEGEVVYSSPEREAAIRIATPGLVLTETRYETGERGARPHIHEQHTDCFYVLEGALRCTLGRDEHLLGAGGLVAIPPGVVHGFDNGADGRSRFLNIHAPNTGFDEYMRTIREAGDADARRELGERTDQWDPPADGGRDPADAVLVADGEGQPLRMGPAASRILASAAAGTSQLAVMRTTLGPGFPGPILHVHERMTDCFYVLSGTLTVRAGADLVELRAGDCAAVEPGTAHTFSNPGDEPVELLNVMTPAGLEDYLRKAAEEAAAAGGPPDPARLAELAADHDFRPA